MDTQSESKLFLSRAKNLHDGQPHDSPKPWGLSLFSWCPSMYITLYQAEYRKIMLPQTQSFARETNLDRWTTSFARGSRPSPQQNIVKPNPSISKRVLIKQFVFQAWACPTSAIYNCLAREMNNWNLLLDVFRRQSLARSPCDLLCADTSFS